MTHHGGLARSKARRRANNANAKWENSRAGCLVLLVGIASLTTGAVFGAMSLFGQDKDSEGKKPAAEIITGEHKKVFELQQAPIRK